MHPPSRRPDAAMPALPASLQGRGPKTHLIAPFQGSDGYVRSCIREGRVDGAGRGGPRMGHRGPGEPADRHARSCSQRRPGRAAARAQKRRTRCTGPSEGGGRAISVRAGRFAGRAGGRAGAHMLVVVASSSGRDPSCLRLDGDSDLLIRASPTMAAGARTRARTRTCGCRPPAARTLK